MPTEVARYEEALAALLTAHTAYLAFIRQHHIDEAMRRNVEKNCKALRDSRLELMAAISTVN